MKKEHLLTCWLNLNEAFQEVYSTFFSGMMYRIKEQRHLWIENGPLQTVA